MGVLNEVFLADDDASAAALVEDGPSEGDVPSVPAVGVSDLASLEEVLTGDEAEGLPLVAELGEDGPWVWGIPPELTAALRSAKPDEALAEEWIEASGWPDESPGRIAAIIEDLAGLARDGRPLYLWSSL